MSKNLDYHDLWNDLYEWISYRAVVDDYYTPYDEIEALMEEMDPRLSEEHTEE